MVPWSGVRKMFNLARNYRDAINLSVGEPDFTTPRHIVEAAIEAMEKGLTHYTPNAGFADFREAVAGKLKRKNQIEADPQTEIMAISGGMGALSTALLTTINPGDEVLIPDPGFASYRAQVILTRGEPVPYRLNEPSFTPDYEEVAALITPRTKAMIINTPSNPTGAVLDETSLKQIADMALTNNLIAISDEAYESITYDGFRHISLASLPEMKDRTISIFSLSKTYAMTGWRIGYAVANPEITGQMVKLQEHLTAHPSSISQMAAVAALNGPEDHVEAMVREYSERKGLIMGALERIQGIECFKPKGAFYVFPTTESFKASSDSLAIWLLEEARVIVVSGTAFGNSGEGHLRISYAASRDRIIQAMERLGKQLKKLRIS